MTPTLLAAAGDMSNGESTVFIVLAVVALAGALGTVLARNAVHSALFLVMTMLSLGIFYFIQGGPFLGVVQIIVYTGAIMILFLFVLMLVGRDSSDSVVETLRGQRPTALVLGALFAALVGAAVYRGTRDITAVGISDVNNSVSNIAALLFHDYVFAFELTSALLITAAIGAMILAHVERPAGTKLTQRELAKRRFATGKPYPEPGPGVFATSNSIATPALLPDGTVAEKSVSRLVEPNLAGVAVNRTPPEVAPGVAPTDTAAAGDSAAATGSRTRGGGTTSSADGSEA